MLKKRSVLDYWLSCIREQDIQKTLVENNINVNQIVSLDDKGVLLSNQRDRVSLHLPSSLRGILKTEKSRQLYRNNKDARPVFFFPLVEIDRRRYPLFYIDLESLEGEILNGKGDVVFSLNPWSVDTSIGVVSDTFARLGYEEEHIDLSGSVLAFIERITGKFTLNFQFALRELMESLMEDGASSNSKVSSFENKGILRYSEFSEATLIFKKDLLSIKGNDALLDSKMIDDFILKEGEAVGTEAQPILGGFFDFPMSEGQAHAVSDVVNSDRSIVSVQGGPGTGKTTLILSTLASKLTQLALDIANGNLSSHELILVSSFNNKAVENVINILMDEYGAEHGQWLAIQFGSKDKREDARERINELILHLKKTEFSREEFARSAGRVKSLAEKISTEAKANVVREVSYNHREISALNAMGLVGDLSYENVSEFLAKIFNVDIDELPSVTSSLIASIKEGESYAESVGIKKFVFAKQVRFYDSIKAEFRRSKFMTSALLNGEDLELESEDVVGSKGVFKRLLSLLGFYSENKHGGLSNSGVVERNKLRRLIAAKGYGSYQEAKSGLEKSQSALVKVNTMISKKRLLVGILNKVVASRVSFSSSEKSRLGLVDKNKALFEASLELLYQNLLREKDVVIERLMNWSGTINTNDLAVPSSQTQEFLSSISKAFPIICSTLSSIGKIFNIDEGKSVSKIYSLSVSDESGVVPIFCMPSLIIRSRKMLVIGDQKQLMPIISIDKNRISEFARKAGLQGKDERFNPMASSAFQRCAFAKEANYTDIGESIILDEHRRCRPAISACFIDIANYTGIKNKTLGLDNIQMDMYKSPIEFIHVDGDNKGIKNTNTEEVEMVDKVLDDLAELGVDLGSQVGIITPFQNQSVLLQNKFRKKLSHSLYRKKIGTVHAFQGAEFDVIIISMVAFSDKFHTKFIAEKPNLLNVAVSRAKNKLIIVGDMGYLGNQGGAIQTLMSHRKVQD